MIANPRANLPQDTYTWTEIRCPDSGGRSSHFTVSYKNYLITYGGWNDNGISDIVALNMDNSTWTRISATGPAPGARYGHTMCLYQENQIIVFGGRDKNVMKDVGLMTIRDTNPLSIKWQTKKTTGLPKPLYRARHSAHIYQNRMYVIAGIDKDKKSTDDVWCLSLDNYSWEECDTQGDPGRRSSHGSVLINDTVYVFGGFITQTSTRLNDICMLSLSSMKWQAITPKGELPCPVYGPSMLEQNGKLYLFGGYKEDGDCSNDFFVYDINTFTWQKTRTFGEVPKPRCYQTATWYQQKIIVWGGWRPKDILFSQIYSLKLPASVTAGAVPQNPMQNKQIIRSKRKNFVLKNLFLDETFADVTFKVEGQNIPGHKNILVVSCAAFDELFKSQMTDSVETVIDIPETKANAFKALLEFLYCGELELKQEFACDLMRLSHRYELLELENKCGEFLSQSLSPDNYVELANLADTLGLSSLKEGVLQFIKENFRVLEKRDDLYDLPKTILVQALSKIGSQ